MSLIQSLRDFFSGEKEVDEIQEKKGWIKDAKKKIKDFPNDPNSYLDYADAIATFWYDKASIRVPLFKALALDPNFYKAMDYLALLEDDPAASTEWYEKSIAIHPYNMLTYILVARKWQKLGNLPKYRETLERALAVDVAGDERGLKFQEEIRAELQENNSQAL